MQNSGHCDKAGAGGYNETTFVQTAEALKRNGLADLGYVCPLHHPTPTPPDLSRCPPAPAPPRCPSRPCPARLPHLTARALVSADLNLDEYAQPPLAPTPLPPAA